MCHLLGLNPAPNNGSMDVLGTTLSSGALKQGGNFSIIVSSFAILCVFIGTFQF